MTKINGRSQPTQTTLLPTQVHVSVYPTPQAAGSPNWFNTPVLRSATSTSNLAAFWSAYKLIFGWIAMTLGFVTLIFIRFLARHPINNNDLAEPVDDSSDDTSPRELDASLNRLSPHAASLATFELTLDLSGSLDHSPNTLTNFTAH